jgi:hypothetical protein
MSTFYRVSSLAAEGEQRGRDAVVLCANSLESQQQPLSLSWATQQSRFVKGQLYILMLQKADDDDDDDDDRKDLWLFWL